VARAEQAAKELGFDLTYGCASHNIGYDMHSMNTYIRNPANRPLPPMEIWIDGVNYWGAFSARLGRIVPMAISNGAPEEAVFIEK
jgi:hypothetical protein